MFEYAKQYPEFDFEKHKGYPTHAHRAAVGTYVIILLYYPIHAHRVAVGMYLYEHWAASQQIVLIVLIDHVVNAELNVLIVILI